MISFIKRDEEKYFVIIENLHPVLSSYDFIIDTSVVSVLTLEVIQLLSQFCNQLVFLSTFDLNWFSL